MFLYFRYNSLNKIVIPDSIDGRIECKKVGMFHDIHSFLWNILGGRLKEYRIIKNKKIVCYARVVNKIFFFPFMGSSGLHIGPCATAESERGKGLYPYLLQHIIQENKGKDFYMIVNESNVSSIKGVVKAGFTPYAKGYKTFFNRYIIVCKINQ